MKHRTAYKLGVDPGGILLFAVIMIPNLIWFLVPAANDIMRAPSITPRIDFVISTLQIILVSSLCLVLNRHGQGPVSKVTLCVLLSLVMLYFLGWCMYYVGHTEVIVIMGLCVAPSLAFIFYALDRKNTIALVFGCLYLIFHTLHWLINYVLPVYRQLP